MMIDEELRKYLTFFFFVCDLEVITRKIASFKIILPSTETLLFVFKFMIKLVVA